MHLQTHFYFLCSYRAPLLSLYLKNDFKTKVYISSLSRNRCTHPCNKKFVRKGMERFALHAMGTIKTQKQFLSDRSNPEARKKQLPILEEIKSTGCYTETALHSKTMLFGEIFKDNFTDIFQTNLEQVAFSLEPHRLSYSESPKASHTSTYKSSCKAKLCTCTKGFAAKICTKAAKRFVRKGLYSITNRRSHYFTTVKSSLPSFLLNRKGQQCSARVHGFVKEKSRVQSSTPAVRRPVPYGRRWFCLTRTDLNRKGVRFALRKSTYKSRSRICKYFLLQSSYKYHLFTNQRFVRKKICTTSLQKSLRTSTYLHGQISDLQPKTSRALYEPYPCKTAVKRSPPLSSYCNHKIWKADKKKLCKKEKIQDISLSLKIRVGDYLSSGDKIGEEKLLRGNAFQQKPIVLNSSGRVLAISKTQLILQKTQPVLFYNSANLHVKKGEWVNEGSPILTLSHQTLITGDIVQGIPRIEQLFEAFTSPPPAFKDKRAVTKFKDVHDTLHSQVRDIFRKHWLENTLPIAVRKSLEEIQYTLVEMIQKVYLSQGVLISDKHIEIIIRQIASKGQILDSGSTGLFLEEVLPIRQIENANLATPGKKCLYVPAVMGLTAAALNSDSFISAASFQETTRVLSRDAVVGKSDFLRGLKEKVVIGDCLSAGTGLDIYFIYTTMLAS